MNGEYIEKLGTPNNNNNKQTVKKTVLNNDKVAHEQYKDTTSQAVAAASGWVTITNNGADKNIFDGATNALRAYDTVTDQFTFVSGRWYLPTIKLEFTTLSNNTTVKIRLINIVDPLDFEEGEVFVQRAGAIKLTPIAFDFRSSGSEVRLECDVDNDITITSVDTTIHTIN